MFDVNQTSLHVGFDTRSFYCGEPCINWDSCVTVVKMFVTIGTSSSKQWTWHCQESIVWGKKDCWDQAVNTYPKWVPGGLLKTREWCVFIYELTYEIKMTFFFKLALQKFFFGGGIYELTFLFFVLYTN